MTPRLTSRAPRALFVFAFMLGCATDTVVIAIERADAGDAGPSDAGAPDAAEGGSGVALCSVDGDCGAGQLCERAGCDAPFGRCSARPVLCSDGAEPVCGCDGVTYYNDCTRLREGVSLRAAGECGGNGAPCDATTPCANGGYCAYLAGSDSACASLTRGACWLLPAQCGDGRFSGDRFAPCSDLDACVDACTAIKREVPHVLQRRCPRSPSGVPPVQSP